MLVEFAILCGVVIYMRIKKTHRIFLHIYRKRYAFIAGIGVVTVISWFRNTAVTYFPDTPEGDARFEYFKQIVRVEGLDMLVTPFSSDLASVALPLLTFFYVDFLGVSLVH